MSQGVKNNTIYIPTVANLTFKNASIVLTTVLHNESEVGFQITSIGNEIIAQIDG